MPNWITAQKRADIQITRFGGKDNVSLTLADGTARTCNGAILQFTPRDIMAGLAQEGDIRILISGKSCDPAPDQETETLVLSGKTYRIVQAPGQLSADGATVLYWDVQARLRQ